VRAYATNDSKLVLPQTVAFNSQGRLVVVDRTHVKIFDLGLEAETERNEAEGRSGGNPRSLVGVGARDKKIDSSGGVVGARDKKIDSSVGVVGARDKKIDSLVTAGNDAEVAMVQDIAVVPMRRVAQPARVKLEKSKILTKSIPTTSVGRTTSTIVDALSVPVGSKVGLPADNIDISDTSSPPPNIKPSPYYGISASSTSSTAIKSSQKELIDSLDIRKPKVGNRLSGNKKPALPAKPLVTKSRCTPTPQIVPCSADISGCADRLVKLSLADTSKRTFSESSGVTLPGVLSPAPLENQGRHPLPSSTNNTPSEERRRSLSSLTTTEPQSSPMVATRRYAAYPTRLSHVVVNVGPAQPAHPPSESAASVGRILMQRTARRSEPLRVNEPTESSTEESFTTSTRSIESIQQPTAAITVAPSATGKTKSKHFYKTRNIQSEDYVPDKNKSIINSSFATSIDNSLDNDSRVASIADISVLPPSHLPARLVTSRKITHRKPSDGGQTLENESVQKTFSTETEV